MIIVESTSLVPGMVIAKDIFDQSYTLMVGKGTALTPNMVSKLKGFTETEFFVDNLPTEANEEVERILTERLSEEHDQVINSVARYFNSVAASNTLDTQVIKNMVDEIQNQINLSSNILLNLSHLKSFDEYLFSHAVNVSIIALIIGRKLNLYHEDLEQLGITALLHDIGMLKIKKEVFDHNRVLSAAEWEQIKEHPVYGAYFIKNSGEFAPSIVCGVMDHHERVDGSGYPYGKKGVDISFFGKIVAVADVYDACISLRKHRKRMTPRQALKNLLGDSHRFDLDVLRAFVASMAIYPIGSYVRLNTGEIAKVVGCNPDQPFRPQIRIQIDKDRQKLEQTVRINLAEEANFQLYIEETMEEDRLEMVRAILES
jgi:HD-GYP domain-containing protein (c-di-GMP phosphodiesterase class II)